MRASLNSAFLLVLVAAGCFAQGDSPLAIIETGWRDTRESARQAEVTPGGPTRAMIAENKTFQRNARENALLTKAAIDPNEQTVDGRSAALDKMSREAQVPRSDDKAGWLYFARVRNDTEKTIEIVFLEYRFTEIAAPDRIVRRQFLCGVKIKPGEEKDLSAFTTLAPSDVISAESLGKATEKIFDEKVQVNRLELTDGTILQRNGWKYDDVKPAIKRVTSTPWGTETCRAL